MIDERLVIIRVSNALLFTLLPSANEVCGGHGFTGVCLSTGVGEGGVLVFVQGGGLRPGGLCSEGSDQGVLCPGDLCPEMVSVGGGGGFFHADPWIEQAVRILLECIPVYQEIKNICSQQWQISSERLSKT